MTIIKINWGGAMYHWITHFINPIVSVLCGSDMYVCMICVRVFSDLPVVTLKIEIRSNIATDHVTMQYCNWQYGYTLLPLTMCLGGDLTPNPNPNNKWKQKLNS